MYIPQDLNLPPDRYQQKFSGFKLDNPKAILSPQSSYGTFVEVCAYKLSLTERLLSVQPGEFGIVRLLDTVHDEVRAIKLGFDFDGNPLCSIRTTHRDVISAVELRMLGTRIKQKKMKWDKVSDGFDSDYDSEKRVAVFTRPERDVWNLKGDCVFGLCVALDSFASLHIYQGHSPDNKHWFWHIFLMPNVDRRPRNLRKGR